MIKIKDIVKKYDGKTVLDNISTEFPEGKTTVIVGPSGSGKSTLLRSLDLLVHPDSGIISFPNFSLNYADKITSKQSKELRAQTSMVFQNWNLFPNLRVIDNITAAPIHVHKVPKKEAIAQANELLKRVGLEKYANFYPDELSGGMQQRISICRALAVKPKYILLDEPTSALDPELETQVLEMLEELAQQGQSMVMITHNIEFAKLSADKMLFIENGEKIFDGSKDEFFNNPSPRIKEFLDAISLQ